MREAIPIQSLASLSDSDLRAALIELCEAGLLTCTRGRPGSLRSSYAVVWLPLNASESFPPEVRARHSLNMAAFQKRAGTDGPL